MKLADFAIFWLGISSEVISAHLHIGENLRTTFHNTKVISQFYKAAKSYNIDEFNDRFNQIRDTVPGAAEHLERVGFHRWSRVFFPGNRYNLMTSNIAESLNSMFNVEREFPIIALFDVINKRFAEKFHERHTVLAATDTIAAAIDTIVVAADSSHAAADTILATTDTTWYLFQHICHSRKTTETP
ncbi:uncharacterized protein LOC132620160 [Lycium barbarum]|uniref:uncharacterized protein LOC132620160 n=1 Tax=Lycium barbarum TaxID=112863 RepID=UPI00293F470B|nr:uncharacterized protein LOC132620160 [Lycium barbarum]